MDIQSTQHLLDRSAIQNLQGNQQQIHNSSLSLNINPEMNAFRQLLQANINQAMALSVGSGFTTSLETEIPSERPNLLEQLPVTPHRVNEKSSTGRTGIDGHVNEMAEKYQVDSKLIHAVIKRESNYDANAKSYAGAQGLMQLMPDTARGLGVTDALDIKQNIEGGTKYLSQMLKRHKGDVKLALASYNAGPGNVDKYGGIPPFKETQNYVQRILSDLA